MFASLDYFIKSNLDLFIGNDKGAYGGIHRKECVLFLMNSLTLLRAPVQTF